jgi:S-formylglutathione hydrolase
MSGTWQRVEIAGKSAEVYEPPGASRPRFGVLHLHDMDLETLRDNSTFTRLFDELRLGCVCPHGGRCWWGDRVCPEFDPRVSPEKHLLEKVLPYFRERWELAPRAIGLQGIGMGGQGALRLAFKQPQVFPVVAAIAAAVDYHELYGRGTTLDEMYDSKEQCRQDTVPMHVHPSHYPPHIFFAVDPDDHWLRGNDRLHEKLNALGVPHEVDFTTQAGDHPGDYSNRLADRLERFLHAGLESESRRLL